MGLGGGDDEVVNKLVGEEIFGTVNAPPVSSRGPVPVPKISSPTSLFTTSSSPPPKAIMSAVWLSKDLPNSATFFLATSRPAAAGLSPKCILLIPYVHFLWVCQDSIIGFSVVPCYN